MAAFTMEEALEVQARQLETEKIKLSDAAYEALTAEVRRRNARGYSSPSLVFRGVDFLNFTSNWAEDIRRAIKG